MSRAARGRCARLSSAGKLPDRGRGILPSARFLTRSGELDSESVTGLTARAPHLSHNRANSELRIDIAAAGGPAKAPGSPPFSSSPVGLTKELEPAERK